MNAKIEAETDDAKKKEYYASAEYTRLEKKKKRIGAARQKTKVVSTLEYLKWHLYSYKAD